MLNLFRVSAKVVQRRRCRGCGLEFPTLNLMEGDVITHKICGYVEKIAKESTSDPEFTRPRPIQ